MLEKPYLARTDDRKILAKVNEISGDPFDWFNNTYMRGKRIGATTFDFFVNWNNNSIPSEVWHKVLWDIDEGLIIKDAKLRSLQEKLICLYDIQHLEDDHIYGAQYLKDDYRVLNKIGFIPKYVFIPNNLTRKDWEGELASEREDPLHNSNYPIVLYQPHEGFASAEFEIYTVKQIIEKINDLRGDSRAKEGKKGMVYSTSSLEGMLSAGETIWPGDCDLLIYDTGTLKPIAIFEIKKHTNHDKRKLEDLSISDYVNMDKRKYASLYLLAKKIGVPLYMIFNPVSTSDDKVIFERVNVDVNDSTKMTGIHRKAIPLPDKNDSKAYVQLYNEIVRNIINTSF